MSDNDPPDDLPDFPFGMGGGGLPFDLSALFGAAGFGGAGAGGGDGGFGAARQLAITIATGGQSEPNVDPNERIELEHLIRVAELQVPQILGLPTSAGPGLTAVPVTRADWAHRSLIAYRPLFEKLGGALGGTPEMPDMDSSDPMSAMMGQLMGMLAPMMMSMTTGSMVGHMATRYLGQYDIPLPRGQEDEIMVVPANLNDFAEEWSLPGQDLRLWVLIHEIGHHTILRVPHVRAALENLLNEFAGGFQNNPAALEEKFGNLDLSNPSAMGDLQNMFGDPEMILGAIRSPLQEALIPKINALTAVIIGVVDHIMDQVGDNLITSYSQLTEALRRRRVEADQSDRFIERLLGLELTQEQCDRGSAFVAGVLEREGPAGLARLWESEINLPTPNEVDAPGLWLERISLPAELLNPDLKPGAGAQTSSPEATLADPTSEEDSPLAADGADSAPETDPEAEKGPDPEKNPDPGEDPS